MSTSSQLSVYPYSFGLEARRPIIITLLICDYSENEGQGLDGLEFIVVLRNERIFQNRRLFYFLAGESCFPSLFIVTCI